MSSSTDGGYGGVPVAHPPRITLQQAPIRVLYKGFDGFDVAFKGALEPEDIAILDHARQTAEKENREVLVEIGPGDVAMHVASTGAKGGYRFRCDTGPFGEVIFIKAAISIDDWNIRVSVKSGALATAGITEVWRGLKDTLANMGIKEIHESISRIDFAVDFLMPEGFSINPDQFVAHARTTNSEYSTLSKSSVQFEQDTHIHFSGRTPSSVTLGKMPNRQVIIYNKRKEIIQRRKLYWFPIWDIDPDKIDASIWRVEIRAGKQHLNFFKIRTFSDLKNQFGDVVREALTAIRYVKTDGPIGNVSRLPLHPLWEAVNKATASALFDYQSGIVPERIIEGRQEEIRDNYNSQIIALLPGALIASGYSVKNGLDNLPDYLNSIEKQVNNHPERFREKLRLAKERLHFTTNRGQSSI